MYVDICVCVSIYIHTYIYTCTTVPVADADSGFYTATTDDVHETIDARFRPADDYLRGDTGGGDTCGARPYASGAQVLLYIYIWRYRCIYVNNSCFRPEDDYLRGDTGGGDTCGARPYASGSQVLLYIYIDADIDVYT